MVNRREFRGEYPAAEDAFRQRMQAQCARIEWHRLQLMQQQGMVLSYNEAALDWIERFAEEFASDYDTR